jgi:hypothetical protein
MQELIETMTRSVVDNADQVDVTVISGHDSDIVEIRVAKADVGQVIGKDGRIAKAMRTIAGAAAMKLNRRVTVSIIEERPER